MDLLTIWESRPRWYLQFLKVSHILGVKVTIPMFARELTQDIF